MIKAVENYFLFHPTKASKGWNIPPSTYPVEELFLPSADGNSIHCWWLPPPENETRRAVLYCHGNGGNLSFRFDSVRRWHELLRTGVLIFDYPGYGKSTGSPSETGCHLAAEASLQFLLRDQGFSQLNLVYYGGSLGGPIACKLARKHPPACLVLNSSFCSFQSMAKKLYPWLPGTQFLKTKLDTLSWIQECTCPVFISHGTADRLVPFSQGEELFLAAHEPKFFHSMAGQDHHHGPDPAFYANLKSFLGW